jgi:hypothetical protein
VNISHWLSSLALSAEYIYIFLSEKNKKLDEKRERERSREKRGLFGIDEGKRRVW